MSDVELPMAHVREQIASAVDVVVHMARLSDGRRVVLEVSVVDSVRDGEPLVTQVFGFRPRIGPRGEFVSTGVEPELAGVLADRGVELGDWLFLPGPDGSEAMPAGVSTGPEG